MLVVWLKGVFLGFSIAAPVGPIGLLCIRRTLAGGRASGFLSGLGAASADAVYGSVAAFGLAALMAWLAGIQSWVHLLGGAFLVWVGVQSFRTPPPEPVEGVHPDIGAGRAYASTFFLTLSNPATVMSFLAIFAGAGIVPEGRGMTAFWLVAGVFCGSALWWFLLCQGVYWLKQRTQPALLGWVNRASGLGLALFGLSTIGSEILRLLSA